MHSVTSHHTSSPRLIAGAMSGTSADGIDVALVRITGRGPDMKATLLRHHAHPYPATLRQAIFRLRTGKGNTSLASLAHLGQQISLAYAAAVEKTLALAQVRPARLAAIAAHGQTLFHQPPLTMQWLDPALLAAAVGCIVISDFRRADCAAGGQGAPLVPFADRILFAHKTKSRVLLNLGGIANITFLPPRAGPHDRLIAFDTGPANCLSDHLMRQRTAAAYDARGARAAKGRPDLHLVEAILQAPYFAARPPKSTDIPSMIALYQRTHQRLAKHRRRTSLADDLATACLISAITIVASMGCYLPGLPDQVIAGGGGTANRTLMAMLREYLRRLAAAVGHPIELLTCEDLGIPSSAKEAIAFALLGAATLDGLPSNIPSATGASRPVILGSITPINA